MVDIDIAALSWFLPLLVGVAVPFVVIKINRSSESTKSLIAEKVRLEELANQTTSLQTFVKENAEKLDVKLKLREDDFRKEMVEIKSKLEFITTKVQLSEYRLDKLDKNGMNRH